MRAPTLLLLSVAITAGGCWAGGKRRPLFGSSDGPSGSQGPALPPLPPARPYTASSEEELIKMLRESPSGDTRQKVVDELVARGPTVRPLVVAALEEELVLADVLDEALRRVDGAPAPTAAVPGGQLTDPPWVEEKFQLALDSYMAGDLYGALRTIDAVLALEPRTVQSERLQRLRRRSLEKLVRETILVAEIATDATVLTPADAMRGVIRLRNLSEEVITLRGGERAEIGLFTVSYEELQPGGNRTRLHVEHAIPLEDELQIQPGESADLPFPVAAESHQRLQRGNVGRYHLGGRLRPHTFLVGESPYSLFVPILREELLVLEPRDLELADQPEAAFLTAVETGLSGEVAPSVAGRQAFVSAIVMARDDREGTVRALVSALEGAQGNFSRALCAALARVTGEPLGFTREEWLLWWRLRRTRPQQESEQDD